MKELVGKVVFAKTVTGKELGIVRELVTKINGESFYSLLNEQGNHKIEEIIEEYTEDDETKRNYEELGKSTDNVFRLIGEKNLLEREYRKLKESNEATAEEVEKKKAEYEKVVDEFIQAREENKKYVRKVEETYHLDGNMNRASGKAIVSGIAELGETMHGKIKSIKEVILPAIYDTRMTDTHNRKLDIYVTYEGELPKEQRVARKHTLKHLREIAKPEFVEVTHNGENQDEYRVIYSLEVFNPTNRNIEEYKQELVNYLKP